MREKWREVGTKGEERDEKYGQGRRERRGEDGAARKAGLGRGGIIVYRVGILEQQQPHTAGNFYTYIVFLYIFCRVCGSRSDGEGGSTADRERGEITHILSVGKAT